MAASDYIAGLRERIGHDLLLVPACIAVVRDEVGRVLVQRRTDDGSWELPGGLLDPGEQPAEALVREVREETGLVVRPTRVLAVRTAETHCYPHGDRIQCVVTVFECSIVGGSLQAGDDEATAHEFVRFRSSRQSSGCRRECSTARRPQRSTTGTTPGSATLEPRTVTATSRPECPVHTRHDRFAGRSRDGKSVRDGWWRSCRDWVLGERWTP